METNTPPRPILASEGLNLLLISPFESDWLHLRDILDERHSTIDWFTHCQMALKFLLDRRVGVVISDVELPDGCWKVVLDALSLLRPPPSLIVSSRLADERLWAEVLNLGGYDVLPTPFDPEEVLRVTTGAWLAWNHRLASSNETVTLTRRQSPTSGIRKVASGSIGKTPQRYNHARAS